MVLRVPVGACNCRGVGYASDGYEQHEITVCAVGQVYRGDSRSGHAVQSLTDIRRFRHGGRCV